MNEKKDADVEKSPKKSKNTPEAPKEMDDTTSESKTSDKKPSWFKTLPGILTGIAAVITAIATLYGALYGGGVVDTGPILPTPTITPTPSPTMTVTPTSTPIATATPPSSVTPTPPAGEGGNSDVSWQKIDVGFTFGEQECLVIGDGRNDGVMRVYSGDGIHAGSDGNIYEFSFINNQWEKISFGEWKTQYGSTDDLCHIEGIVIGKARNDGVNRVYGSGLGVAEFYYNSDSWHGGDLGNEISSWVEGLVLGDARNDGHIRMYVPEVVGGIFELSYNYGDWDAMEIDTGGQWVEKLVVTDGRNDGILRLYASIDDHVYEYSWSENTWKVEDCGTFDVYNFADMCAGDGRNDNKNRIYLASSKGIYEVSYVDQNWQHITVSDSVTVSHIIIANGRNDGINRLYTGGSKGVGEYTYSGSWVKTSNIETSYKVNGLAVGDGRNDGVNRIYVTGDDKHVYEYSIG